MNESARWRERMVHAREVINVLAATEAVRVHARFTPGLVLRSPHRGRSRSPCWASAKFHFIDRFIESARDISFAMPRHVVDLVTEALNDRSLALKGARVGILGVAFSSMSRTPAARRPTSSPCWPAGADIWFRHDPHVPSLTIRGNGVVREGDRVEGLLGWADVVVVTAHAAIDWPSVDVTAPRASIPWTVRGRHRGRCRSCAWAWLVEGS